MGFTLSVLHAVSLSTRHVLHGELLTGETEVGLRWRAYSGGGDTFLCFAARFVDRLSFARYNTLKCVGSELLLSLEGGWTVFYQARVDFWRQRP